MTTTTPGRAGLSPRDRRLLLAFAFFAEAVILYMFLIDPLLTRLSQANALEATTRAAHGELAATVRARSGEGLAGSEQRPLAPMLLADGEIATLAIQQHLGSLARDAGARLVQANVSPASERRGGLENHEVAVQVEGSYDAIAAFVEALGSLDPVRGIERMALTSSVQGPDRVEASLTLRFYHRRS